MVASYGYQGLAGKPCDPAAVNNAFFCPPGLPPDVSSNFRHSVEDFFDHDGAVNWTVGGVFSIPLGNHQPRARRRSAEIELRRTRTQRARQVQDQGEGPLIGRPVPGIGAKTRGERGDAGAREGEVENRAHGDERDEGA